MGNNDVIESLTQMVQIMWEERAVSQANHMFIPRSKNPFLSRMQRVISLMQQPVVSKSKFGIQRAIVIDTRDPLKLGRVKVKVTGSIHSDVKEQDLNFVNRCEFWGSLEDQGSTFIPPAGSMVFVGFEAGEGEYPLVLGCIWVDTRSVESGDEGGMLILEERERWSGGPGLRADGKNENTNSDKKHLMPPWNNESYNGKDNATNERPAIPHIYGIKSPEKHFLQMVDGDFDKALKGKRVVLQTSRGSVLYMKDDEISSSDTLYKNQYIDDHKDAYPGLGYKSSQPYNDHKIELVNTGVQLQSFAGHRLIMSDELERNTGTDNKWNKAFNPGERFCSFICLQSITEHKILLRDNEWSKGNRSQTDGIFAITATGHYIGMEEDTVGGVAGKFRRIYIHSTSNHSIEMNDQTAIIASPPRKGDGTVYWSAGKSEANAWGAYFHIKSGWGQGIEFNDYGSQKENSSQFLIIRNENREEKPDCHPWPAWNYIRMNCVDNDKQFLIWAAGRFRLHVCHDCVRQVHKGHDLVYVQGGAKIAEVNKNIFYRANESITLWSVNERIRLLSGELDKEGNMKLREYPVVVAKEGGFEASEHVFASE